jgi:uncharacterized membrane protein
MLPVPAVLFYNVVLAVHIAAIVIAFGATFAYGVMVAVFARTAPEGVPAFHRSQQRLDQVIITPFATLALVAGAYMASDRHYWSETWVTVPLVILVVLMGLTGAFFIPHERRAAELAERDLAAGRPFGPEYQAVSRRIAGVGALAGVLVLVAIFFMAAKP